MINRKHTIHHLLGSALLILVSGLSFSQDSAQFNNSSDRKDLKRIYDDFRVDGTFVLYGMQVKKYIFYNPSLYRQPVSPASTFNILLSMIGLEEGILVDESSLMKPYGLSLKEAFRHNVDSCFIELSLAIGEAKISDWLRRIHYGNGSIAGEKGRFWINGLLQITPEQQLAFIKAFYFEELPFSKKNYQIVKELMNESNTAGLGLKIYGKRGSNKLYKINRYTGGLYARDKYTGWFIGFIEATGETYFFVNYIESPDLHHPLIVDAQKEIVYRICKSLGLK
jgi:beta-lactamase class D